MIADGRFRIAKTRIAAAIAVLIGAALLAAGTAWSVARQSDDGGAANPGPPAAAPSISLPPLVMPTRVQSTVFFGDSWTEGVAAKPRQNGYAYLAGQRLGGDFTVFGAGGTGYLNSGITNEGSFPVRMRRLNTDPTVRLVVIQGGINDLARPGGFGNAVADTIKAAKDKYPNGQIVVFVIMPSSADYSGLVTMSSTIGFVAQSNKAYFVSANRWLDTRSEKGFLDPANNHPTNAGHEVLASRVFGSLQSLTRTGQTFTP